MIETSAEIKELAAALIGVQGAVEGVVKDKSNPHFKNRYATLEAVIDTARPALQANGIAFTQAPGAVVDGSVEITTMLMHASGQWMRSTLHVPLGKRDPQGVGSAITYGCRYSLMATLGLPSTDDDGEAATDRSPPRAKEAGASAPNPALTPPPEPPSLPLTIAEGMIAAIKRRPKTESLTRLRESPQFVADLESLPLPEQQRVQREYENRRAHLLQAGL